MALGKVFGIKIKADSQDAVHGVNSLRRAVKEAKAEAKAMNSTLGDWQNSSKGLENQLKSLTLQYNAQKKVLNEYKETYENLVREQEAQQKVVDALTKKYGENSSEVNKAKSELDKLTERVMAASARYNNQVFTVNKLSEEYDKFAHKQKEVQAGLIDLAEEIEDGKVELDALAAALDNPTENLHYMTLALQNAEKNLKLQENTLELYKKELSEIDPKAEGAADAIAELNKKIHDQEAEVVKATAAAQKQRVAMKQVESSSKGFGKFMKTLKDRIEDVKTENELLNNGFTVLKGTLSNLITHGLLGLRGRMETLMTDSKNLRRELGMLEATARNLDLTSADRESAKNTMKMVYSVDEDTTAATEAINNLLSAKFDFDDVGPTLDDITRQILGASIKWKETLSVEGLSDSIQEAIGSKGMSVTGQFAELIERMGIDLEKWKLEFGLLGTEAERQDKIYQTLASGGLEDVLKQYEEINGKLIEENKAVYDTLSTTARFTESMAPLIVAIQQGYNILMEKVADFAEENEEKIKQISKAIVAFFEKLGDGLKWVLDNLELVALAFGTAFAVNHAMTAAAAISKLTDKLALLGAEALVAQGKFISTTAAMDAASKKSLFSSGLLSGAKIAGIGLAIAAVAAGLVYLYKTNDEFRASVQKMWETLKPALEQLWNSLKGLMEPIGKLFTTIAELVTYLLETLLPILMPIIEYLILGVIGEIEKLVAVIEIAVAGIKSAIDIVLTYIKSVIEFYKAVFKSIKALISGDTEEIGKIWENFGKKLKEMWGNVWKGIVDGLGEGFKNLWTAFTGSIERLINWFKDKFGIHSPSTLMAGFGKNIIQGLINGISNMFGNIKNTITSIVNFFTNLPSRIWAKIKDIGSKIADAFKSAVNLVKDIGGNIVTGLWNGINDKTAWVKNKITGFASKIGKSITDFFDINSPSKWAMTQGGFIAQGFGQGVLNGANGALKNVNKFNNKMASGFGFNGASPSAAAGGTKIINAGLTVQYNKELSLKEISKLESKYYSNIRKFK